MSGFANKIKIGLILQDGPKFQSQLTSVQGREVELSFPIEGPHVSLTTRVTLHFSGDGLSHDLSVPARVLARDECESERRYRFLLEGEIEDELKRCLRRRDAFRVSPDPMTTIRLYISALDGPAEGRVERAEAELMNISLLGLSIRVHPELELTMTEVDQVRVELDLPEAEAPITIQGRIVGRRMKAGAVLLGVEIEGMESHSDRQVEQQLTQFVVRRQMEDLGGV
ncbi:MAG: hypothetical protein ACI841_001158 [Planctomycetota bacterium]|jgi:hypothetical protein